MINNRFYICIFAASPRGSGLRRGATRERLEADKGRHLVACKFDLSGTQQGIAPFHFFLGLVQAFFWAPFGVYLRSRSLKVTK